MAEWQPIETAPVGVTVLIYMPWINKVAFAGLRCHRGEWAWRVVTSPGDTAFKLTAPPSHWQPLPEPPVMTPRSDPAEPDGTR
jgi:hypothetical protein